MSDIEFLTNQADKIEGLAYAGFETFRGSPYTSCARETGQNSRDAASGKGPVRVRFKLLRIPRADVPFADHLQRSIECCLQAPGDDKTKQHLERAHQQIASPLVKILEIADTNTTGLTGPTNDPHSVFAALVKGDGVTNKSESTSAGSYGIGKNAAYAVSDLQTVIYSTRYLDKCSGEERFAAQGRLRLISHADGQDKFSAEGYWGNPGFAAIEDETGVPKWVARQGIGTSIYSVGFREHDRWIDRMTLSLATNFFLAIDRQDIEFSIGDGAVELNRSSLDGSLSSENLKEIARDVDQQRELERAQSLLRCLRSDVTVRHTIAVEGLGDFTLHLLVAEDLPREVHVVRNGIYITDNFSKFGQPMKRFPATREFIAVLEPSQGGSGTAPSELLKRLENPAHDAFEPERIVDDKELQKARTQIKSLLTSVREIIRSVAKLEDNERSQIEELSHLFAQGGARREGATGNVDEDPERFKYGEAHRTDRAEPPSTGEKGKSKRRHGKTGTTRKRTRSGTASRRTGSSAGARPAVELTGIRSVLPDRNDPRRRTVYFTPSSDGKIELSVSAAGLSSDVALTIAGAASADVVKGRVRTEVQAGQRATLELTFAEPFAGPIELSVAPVIPTSPPENV